VELVGPAGAGKTTLSQALSRRSKRIVMGAYPYVRRVGDMPFFVKNGLLLVSTFLRLYQDNSRWLTRREIAWMMILMGWHHLLGQGVSSESTVIILDQGPVYFLAELHGFGPESLKSQNAERWWKNMYNQWAATLDMVVWLDTSDIVLMERIRTRGSWHLVKAKPAPVVFEFLARWRAAYEQVISVLTANSGGPKVVSFDTAQESVDEIVNQILIECGLKDCQGQVVRRYTCGAD
jgi:shikimate kinase